MLKGALIGAYKEVLFTDQLARSQTFPQKLFGDFGIFPRVTMLGIIESKGTNFLFRGYN